MPSSYKESGVDLEAAEKSTKSISALAKSTFNQHVIKGIGLFSGFFKLDIEKYHNPIIVSSVDGVGTKLKIAFAMNKHDTIGQDLVNHCVNDLMVSGADPLFFLDYIGSLNLNVDVAEKIVKGMSIACQQNNCALIGGETAEMPGFYQPGEYDLAGTIVGAVNEGQIIDGSTIQSGDLLCGIPSNGLHTNGFSLARKVLFSDRSIEVSDHCQELGESWGENLLRIHRSYASIIKEIRRDSGIAGMSHITGGGIVGNTKRLLRENLDLEINWDNWTIPVVFNLIQEYGEIPDIEMRRVFNLGIGLVIIVKSQYGDNLLSKLKSIGEKPCIIGSVI